MFEHKKNLKRDSVRIEKHLGLGNEAGWQRQDEASYFATTQTFTLDSTPWTSLTSTWYTPSCLMGSSSAT